MNYSDWLRSTYPQLVQETDVKVQNYVRQAKAQTQFARRAVFVLTIILVALLGFSTGYLFGKYTDVASGVLSFCAVLVGLLFFYGSHRIEQRLIKQKLTELVTNY